MSVIRKTSVFRKWMKKLKDLTAKAHISAQQEDIAKAKRLAREDEEEDYENE